MDTTTNSATIIGHLGREADVRTTSTGKTVATLSVATNGGNKTDWHRITAWGLLAKRAKTLAKGARVMVVGRIQYGSYEDAEGITRYTTEIVANELAAVPLPSRHTDPAAAEVDTPPTEVPATA